MRLLHLVPSTAWGGAERVAETLHALALSRGWQCELDTLREGEGYLPWALRGRARWDVVHAHLPWPDRLGPALVAARHRALVVTFHLLPEPGRWPRDRFLRVASERALGLAGRLRGRARWVALSGEDQATLSGWLRAPVDRIRNAPPAPLPVKAPVVWPEGALRLLSVGRLEWQKGYDLLLTALAHPAVRALPWHWMLIGEGADRGALEARARALGLGARVTFLGSRAASEGYHAAEWLLAPSRREGMPLVPLEAMEAGVPVLASSIAPHRELFERAPDALLPDEVALWPEALARLLASPEERRALAASQRNVIGNAPRDALWDAYEARYRAVSLER